MACNEAGIPVLNPSANLFTTRLWTCPSRTRNRETKKSLGEQHPA